MDLNIHQSQQQDYLMHIFLKRYLMNNDTRFLQMYLQLQNNSIYRLSSAIIVKHLLQPKKLQLVKKQLDCYTGKPTGHNDANTLGFRRFHVPYMSMQHMTTQYFKNSLHTNENIYKKTRFMVRLAPIG